MISIMQKAWKWISPKIPDSNELLSKAQHVGTEQGVVGVMSMLEQVARQRGWQGAFEHNQLWQSFKQKQPDEVIPHAQGILKETGKLNAVMTFFGGNKNG